MKEVCTIRIKIVIRQRQTEDALIIQFKLKVEITQFQ